MLPVLAGEVIVTGQPIPVLHHTSYRLGIVAKDLLESFPFPERLIPTLRVHHGATCGASYFNYINLMSDALGIVLEEAFEGKEKGG